MLNCLPVALASDPSVLTLLGAHQFDLARANEIAAEFNWKVRPGNSIRCAAPIKPGARLAAVLFHHHALGAQSWMEALCRLKSVLPDTPLIVCHGFAEPIDWSRLSDAGAFHRLQLPLKSNELRQSFGFAWQAALRMNTAVAAAPELSTSRDIRLPNASAHSLASRAA